MAFGWNPFRLNRLRSAVRSYNAAITRRVTELENMGMADYAMYLPKKTTVQEVQDRIATVNDFRRVVGYRNDLSRGRTSELNRILKTVDRHALDIQPDEHGRMSTRYEQREKKYNERAIRSQRNNSFMEMQSKLHVGDAAIDFAGLSAPEYAAMTSDTDMIPEGGERDNSVEDVEESLIRQWEYEDSQRKRTQVMPEKMYEVYMDMWKNRLNMHHVLPGYQDVIDAMEWLADYRADVLNKMFNSGRDEMDPQYITESGGNSNPYVNTPYETRHNRTVNYVLGIARSAGYDG